MQVENMKAKNKKCRVFLNASLSSQAERLFNRKLKDILTTEGFDCLLPQEVLQPTKSIDSIQVLRGNTELIKSCDIVLSVLDKPGEGVIFELGVAFALGKPIVVFRSDEQDYLGKVVEGLFTTIPSNRKATSLDELRVVLNDVLNETGRT